MPTKPKALPAPMEVVAELAESIREVNSNVSALHCYIDYEFNLGQIEVLHRLADDLMEVRRNLYLMAAEIRDRKEGLHQRSRVHAMMRGRPTEKRAAEIAEEAAKPRREIPRIITIKPIKRRRASR